MLNLRKLGSALLALAMLTLTATAVQAATKIHWYGQAAFKIVTPNGGVILIDPWLTVPTNPDKNSIAELGKVDYILITHGHSDHVGDLVAIAKKTGAKVLAPYGLMYNLISVVGIPKEQMIYGGNVGGTIDLPKADAKVWIVNAEHGSELVPPVYKAAPGQPAALASGNPVGYVLMIKGGPTIYHTGDTGVTEDMKIIPMFHHIDLMLACIGGYFTMDPAEAALAVQWVKPKHVIPMHFGTFPLLSGTPAQFEAALKKRGLGKRMIEMKPGGDLTF